MTIIKLNLYTEEEREKIWDKVAKKIHPYNYEERTKDELLKYIYDLEEELCKYKTQSNYYKKEAACALKYKERAHKYKIELGRCVRKLTRIYKKVYTTAILAYVYGRTELCAREIVDVFKHM